MAPKIARQTDGRQPAPSPWGSLWQYMPAILEALDRQRNVRDRRVLTVWDYPARAFLARLGRAKAAAAARAAPALANQQAQRAQEKAKRYAEAMAWQRKHPNARPYRLANYLGVSARTLRRILRGR